MHRLASVMAGHFRSRLAELGFARRVLKGEPAPAQKFKRLPGGGWYLTSQPTFIGRFENILETKTFTLDDITKEIPNDQE